MTTDKADYAPYSTVEIGGNGYARRCNVTVRVTRPDGSVVTGDGSGTVGSDLVTIDDAGNLAYEYLLNKIEGVYSVDVIGADDAVLAKTTFTDAFGLSKLRLGGSAGQENYVYTAGNVIFPEGAVDPPDASHPSRSYNLVVKDGSGQVQGSVPCTSTNSYSSTNNTYTVQDDDPTSTGTAWSYTLQQFDSGFCTGTPKKTAVLYFDVAKARSFSDSGLTTPRDVFTTGTTAYVTVAGVGVVKTSPSNTSQSDWSTTWIQPSTATACANTGGGDRPDSTAGGVVPATGGSFLQYRPNTTGTGDAWNRESNYETRPCIDFGSTTQGTWKLRLEKNATHFVVLPVFTITTGPSSVASSPALSNSTTFTVNYSASDSGAAGVKEVELWVQRPGDSSYSLAATDTSPASPSFAYTAAAGDGGYRFYTRARDDAGKYEDAPANPPDSTTVVDTAKPSSAASSPALSNSTTFTVNYSASDSGAAGVKEVELWVQRPGDSSYNLAATDTSPASPSFAYTAAAGDGSYRFYTRARDDAGNYEDAPANSADSTTVVSATLYVDQNNANCSNTGSGSVAQPFCTIGAAASRATGGTTVLVASGTYNEQVSPNSGSPNNPVVFGALPGSTVTVTGGSRGFYLSGKTWVTIEGFNVTRTDAAGIYVSQGSHINLVDNQVSYAGEPVSGSAASGIRLSETTDSLVAYNTVDHNSSYGVLLPSSTRNQIIGNRISFNAQVFERAAAGIRLYGSSANTVSSNVSHDNEDSGIEIYTGSNSNYLQNNVTYNNGDHGIDVYSSTGQSIVSNSVYKNVTAGINVEGGSTGTSLANNISVDNGIQSPRTHSDIRVESGSTSGTTMDYDLVHLSTSDVLLIWNSVSYTSLASFQSATGQEAHGIQADPRWRSPIAGDFHLTSGSSAIDSGNSGATGETAADVEGNGRIDDPSTPNTGVGPRAYDDRGAYEFQFEPAPDAPPAAALTVTPASGTVNLAATADASGSTDTDATPIASYSFDFGDGSAVVGPQAGATATHTYTVAGTYTVTVTVKDTAGLSSTATATVQVNPSGDDPPAAALSVTPDSGTVNLTVTADASGSTDTDATPIASYSFDFGDGSAVVGPQAEATAAHTYTVAGTYTVTVTVTDSGGLVGKATAQVIAKANLVRNPSFETDSSGWNTSGSGSGIALTRVSGGHTGSWAAQLTNTGTTASTCLLNDSPNWVTTTSAGTYTGTLWVRADTAGATLKLRFREYSGGTTLVGSPTTTQVMLTTSWQKVTVTYTPASPGSSTLDFNAYVSSAAPGTCFYADDASMYLS